MTKHDSRRLSPVFVIIATLVIAPAARAQIFITPADGFSLTWNGNEGDHFSGEDPAPVPANLATAEGARAFTSSDLGAELGIAYHLAENLNDGLYGNVNSWIGGGSPEGVPFAAVAFGREVDVMRFAFGRDNGNAGEPTDNGQYTDRSTGFYTVQITRVAAPDATTEETGDAATGWQTVGTLEYLGSEDAEIGGGFTSYYRHEFEVRAEGGGAVRATALRLVVPGTGMGGGTAIDELEVYSTPGVVTDADGDGFDDEVEKALGFNPADPTSTPESLVVAETALEFKFHAAKGVKYLIEGSADLKTWEVLETGVIGRGAAVSRLYSTSGGGNRYFRAKRE